MSKKVMLTRSGVEKEKKEEAHLTKFFTERYNDRESFHADSVVLLKPSGKGLEDEYSLPSKVALILEKAEPEGHKDIGALLYTTPLDLVIFAKKILREFDPLNR